MCMQIIYNIWLLFISVFKILGKFYVLLSKQLQHNSNFMIKMSYKESGDWVAILTRKLEMQQWRLQDLSGATVSLSSSIVLTVMVSFGQMIRVQSMIIFINWAAQKFFWLITHQFSNSVTKQNKTKQNNIIPHLVSLKFTLIE